MKWRKLSSFVGILEHWQVNREGGSPSGHGLNLWETRALEAAAGTPGHICSGSGLGLPGCSADESPASIFLFFPSFCFFFAEQQFLENVHSQENRVTLLSVLPSLPAPRLLGSRLTGHRLVFPFFHSLHVWLGQCFPLSLFKTPQLSPHSSCPVWTVQGAPS